MLVKPGFGPGIHVQGCPPVGLSIFHERNSMLTNMLKMTTSARLTLMFQKFIVLFGPTLAAMCTQCAVSEKLKKGKHRNALFLTEGNWR